MMTFKHWLLEMWMEHKDEYAGLGQVVPETDIAAYFNKYKYWLKREYRHYQGKL
jgi:hypothetical protein